MKILALDVSTKTGWAILNDGSLADFGLIRVKVNDFNVNDRPELSKSYPGNIIQAADMMAIEIEKLIHKVQPQHIVIENSVKGRNRHTQRLLEFIHKSLLDIIITKHNFKMSYMDPSEWRKVLEIRLSSDQKKNNRLVSTGKKRGKITKKHLSTAWANHQYNLKLKLKDNDIADAICLGSAFYSKSINEIDINVSSHT